MRFYDRSHCAIVLFLFTTILLPNVFWTRVRRHLRVLFSYRTGHEFISARYKKDVKYAFEEVQRELLSVNQARIDEATKHVKKLQSKVAKKEKK